MRFIKINNKILNKKVLDNIAIIEYDDEEGLLIISYIDTENVNYQLPYEIECTVQEYEALEKELIGDEKKDLP